MLTPYDGSGYGKSNYWKKKANDIAREYGEDCSCWGDSSLFDINFGRESFKITLECKDPRNTCNTIFSRTEKKIESMFKEFYRV